jgi:hypothetical protein
MHINRGTTGGGLRSSQSFGQASLPLAEKIFEDLNLLYGKVFHGEVFFKAVRSEMKSGLSPPPNFKDMLSFQV